MNVFYKTKNIKAKKQKQTNKQRSKKLFYYSFITFEHICKSRAPHLNPRVG